MTGSADDFAGASFGSATASSVAVAEQPQLLADIREKPVVVTGASGFVGTRLCTRLVEDGWKVRALVRNTSKAAQRLGHLKLEMRVGDIRDADSVRAAMRDAGSVVHLAAIALEKPGQSYATVNTEATRIVLESAKAESVERVVHMSQNGSDSASPYPFLRSKGIAQDLVTESNTQWTILRPSVIFGPEDEFVNVLARLVRLSPLVFPVPGGGTAMFQPIAVGDVVRAIVKVLEDDSTVHHSYSLGGPMPLSLRQMTERILIAMNASRVLVGVPVAVLKPVIALGERLLPNPPVTTGLLDLLKIDNVIERNDLSEQLGISPTPFAPEELLYLKQITVSSALRSLFR